MLILAALEGAVYHSFFGKAWLGSQEISDASAEPELELSQPESELLFLLWSEKLLGLARG